MEHEEKPTFGTLLHQYRRARNLTQEELGEQAGYSSSYMSMLETGDRPPSLHAARQLSNALKLSPLEHYTFFNALPAADEAERSGDPTDAPAASTPLVGREEALEDIHRHLVGEGPSVLLFLGEPGIGKSRLLWEAIRLAKAQGWTIIEGRCRYQAGQDVFSPMGAALWRYLLGLSQTRQQELLAGCHWLGQLLPDAGRSLNLPPCEAGLRPAEERQQVFAALGRFLRNSAGTTGTLLVLDDLQWADVDALDLLHALLGFNLHFPLRLVGAYRDTELRPEHPVALTLADFGRQGISRSRKLERLRKAESLTLLRSLLDDQQNDPLLEAIARWGEGVPFYLVNWAKTLQEGLATVKDIPLSIAQSVYQRIAAHTPAAKAALAITAIAGQTIARSDLIEVMHREGFNDASTHAALDALCYAALLTEADTLTYHCAHDLIRDVVLGRLSAAQHAILHEQIASVLEERYGLPVVEQLAYHYARSDNSDKALFYLEKAAERAEAAYAFAQAEGYYLALIERLEHLHRQAEVASARERLGALLLSTPQSERALATLQDALEAYRALQDYEGMARVAAQIGWCQGLRGALQEGMGFLRVLLEAPETNNLSARGRSLLYKALAQLLARQGTQHELADTTKQAMLLAAAAQDADLLAQTQVMHGFALSQINAKTEGLALLREAIAAIETKGNLWNIFQALSSVNILYASWGDLEQLDHYTRRAIPIAQTLDHPSLVAEMLFYQSKITYFHGDWPHSRELCDRALAAIADMNASWLRPHVEMGIGHLCMIQGEYEQGQGFLQAALRGAEPMSELLVHRWVNWMFAERAVVEGQPEQAIARLEPLYDATLPQDIQLIQNLPILAWAYLEAGKQEDAEILLTKLLTLARERQIPAALFENLRIQALLESQRANYTLAHAALAEALAHTRQLRWPYYEAKVHYCAGHVALRQQDPAAAREHWLEALRLLDNLGEQLYSVRIRRILSELSER